ncbi:MAG: tRNA (adenosine(37)-N6)-dimethylallyltransferase MiaA [Lachnospiraceae bacterium]|nr:tRNA (adenosine(37)-N6)-dimethylallyltransferase MiaA [Lachnospiraceae bacterium]
MRKKLAVLTGPTAVGKTGLSIGLARATGGEVISADSMQVYRGMDIGSAKITEEEKEGIPHHLIDVLSPLEDFDVTVFQSLASEAVEQITDRGHLPLVVGGTGFYIQALLYGIDFDDKASDPGLRKELEQRAIEIGGEALHAELSRVDPESGDAIPAGNVKRVIRALEFYELTGRKISEHNREQRLNDPAYDFVCFVLTDERETIYERIDRRVDLMMEQGLVEEVEDLRRKGVTMQNTAMQGLGYREIYRYLNGEFDLEEAVRLIKRNTRHFAKRQLTWYRNREDAVWVNKNEFDHDEEKMLAYMLDILKERGITT